MTTTPERFIGTCPVCHDREMAFEVQPRQRRKDAQVWDQAECGGCGAITKFDHTHPATNRICFRFREAGCPSN